MTVLLVLVSLISNVNAAPSAQEAEAIWFKACGTNLDVAFQAYGSLKPYHNDREEVEIIKSICLPAKEKQAKHALEHPKLSIEEHACLYLTELEGVVVGFGKGGSNALNFGFDRCEKL